MQFTSSQLGLSYVYVRMRGGIDMRRTSVKCICGFT